MSDSRYSVSMFLASGRWALAINSMLIVIYFFVLHESDGFIVDNARIATYIVIPVLMFISATYFSVTMIRRCGTKIDKKALGVFILNYMIYLGVYGAFLLALIAFAPSCHGILMG